MSAVAHPAAETVVPLAPAQFPTNQDLDPQRLRQAFGTFPSGVVAVAGQFELTLDPQRLRQAFGTFPSGVVAVAAEVDGVLTGLAASSFTSVSLEPPLVSFSIANTSKTWPDLRRAERLGVTVLADHHGVVCRQLAGPPADRFTDVDATVADDGAVTIAGGLAHFDCSIHAEVEAGDHTIVLLELHRVDSGSATVSPLVFHRSGFERLRDREDER